jgi:TetR/AcrR family transcriptional regulator, repressor for uid operon
MATTASRRPGRPPAAKADETRKRILQAAREVFSERGYDGATFQAIAVRADLTRPAINHYFPSKRLLYRDVVQQTNELIIGAGIQRARRETTMLGRLTAFITNAMHANSENRSMSAFMVTAVLESQRHPELSRAENHTTQTSRDFLMWVVNEAIERGEIAPDIDADTLVETLLVVLCGVGFYAGYLRGSPKMDTVTEMLRQLLEGGVWRPKS